VAGAGGIQHEKKIRKKNHDKPQYVKIISSKYEDPQQRHTENKRWIRQAAIFFSSFSLVFVLASFFLIHLVGQRSRMGWTSTGMAVLSMLAVNSAAQPTAAPTMVPTYPHVPTTECWQTPLGCPAPKKFDPDEHPLVLEGCPYDQLTCTNNKRSASFYEAYACNKTVACEMSVYSAWENPGGWTASPLDLNITRCTCGAGTYGAGCGLVCPEITETNALMGKLCPAKTDLRAKCNRTAGEIWDGTFDNIGAKSKYMECYLLHDEQQSGLGEQIVGGVKKHRINMTIYQNVTPGKLSDKVPHTIEYSITSRFRPEWDDVGGLNDPRFKQCSTRYNRKGI
jgi:hypothetical protein